ncbi:MAG: RNA-binding protein [Desulfobulbaceae bacterium]|nr:RNA-binding protein [Desulfobulbaceae bacterium]
MKTLYVGNLPEDIDANGVRRLFASQGTVHGVTLIIDRKTGKQRGFGFIDMDDLAAVHAISTFNRKRYGDNVLTVSEAHAQKWRPPARPRYKTD